MPLLAVSNYTKDDAPIRMLHIHDCLEIGFCHEGSGVLLAGEKALAYAAGDVTFINHTEVHFSTSLKGTTSRWSWLLLDPVRLIPSAPDGIADPGLLAGPGFGNVFPGAQHPELHDAVTQVLAECEARTIHWEAAVRALILRIMILVRRARHTAGEAPARQDYDRLAPALQKMAASYASPLHVPLLAKLCGLSEPHFRRLFRATLRRSPQAYWLDLRLSMAASALRTTSRSVLEISETVGFGTLSSFNRLFRRRFGCPPRVWRHGSGRPTLS